MGRALLPVLRLAVSCSLVLGVLAACDREEEPPPPSTPPPSPTVIAPPPLTATPIEVGGEARPILHMDVETTGIITLVVTKASHPDGREAETVIRTVGAAWSPKGTQIAFVSPSGHEMNIANLQGEQETLIHSSGQWRPFYAWPSWSPDGGKIALIEVGWCMDGHRISDVIVVDVASGKATSRYGPHDFWFADATQDGPGVFSMPEALRWSADGSKFLISWDKAVVLDFETTKIEVVSPTRVVAEWSPDSGAVYFFDAQHRDDGRIITSFNVKRLGAEAVTLANRQRLEELGMVGAPGLIPALVALSPSGSTMAVAAGQSVGGTKLSVYDMVAGEYLDLAAPSQSFDAEGRVVAMDWSPDEGSIAVLAVDQADTSTLRVVDLAAGVWTTVGTPAVETSVIDDIPTVLSWGR